MNRRNFIGIVAGGIVMGKLGVAGSYGLDAITAAGEVGPQRSWIDNGMIDAGGSHEPYLFVTRCGGQSLDARRIYENQQSEDVIRQLKNQGVEVFHTHLYKGFGMIAEKPEMEDTVRTAAVVHRLGMKIDTYIQWGSMMYETFFAEEARAPEWIQRDAFGQPIMLCYGYQQSFRYIPCFSNQEYLDYLKKVVRFALEEVKTDFIHFDNFAMNSEPDSCHCDSCKNGFRAYLRTRYSPRQRKDRFGFENVDYVNPPLWNLSNPPEQLDIISDPVFQEWIDYRCQTMADALGQMVHLIESSNRDVVVEVNCGGITGDNAPWTHGTDPARILKLTRSFWDEADQQHEYLPDGRLITAIRTYKAARAYQNVALLNTSGNETAIAECLAFNQTIGFAGVDPLSSEMVKYVSFYRRRRDMYVGSRDVASVAVFRSYPSITYHHSKAALSAILVEQTLIQARIPFTLIFDEDLSQLSLSTCKVFILPDSECLSDEQIAAVRKYVDAGGGLIATGRAGLYDSWRRSRVTPGLQDLVGWQAPAAVRGQQMSMANLTPDSLLRKEFGRGRVVYIPEIIFDGPLPTFDPYFTINTNFWKRPKNWKELVDAVDWAAQNDLAMRVDGPDFLGANLVEQREKRRRLVHLVNYNTAQVPFIENIEVKCAVPEGNSARTVRLYSPASDAYDTLNFRMQGADALFTVPKLNTYCMVTVSW
ncbi:MAG: alpha-amylase family protein [Silvibacterium sp.]